MHTTSTSATLALNDYAPGRGWASPLPALDSERTLVLAFAAPGFVQTGPNDPLADLRAAYPQSHILGCSTAGEIADTRLLDGGVSLAVMRFARTRLASVSAPVRSPADSFAAGAHIGNQLDAQGLRGVLVLSDGLKVNGSELVRGLNSVLPPTVVVTGGLAADGDRFKQTWVLRNGAPEEGFVAAIGFYGDHVRIAHGSKGGWDTFGPERTVTRSEGNVLYELDGRPALPLYKQYLGDRAAGLPSTALLFPLALRQDADCSETLVRTVLSVDEAKQAMVFAGDIPQGYKARLMRANFDRLIAGAGESALMTVDGQPAAHGNGPRLSIAVSCVGRRLVLGERVEEELESTLAVLPAGTRQVGFYSYGELSPCVSGAAPCMLHNQTMTLTTIAED
jgi:hypothetical protein